MYRWRRPPTARRAARAADYRDAMFPWRSTVTGEEEMPNFQFSPLSKHWLPDQTRLQRHIGAAIANSIWHFDQVTGDALFLSNYGAEMTVEIARFWCSITRHDPTEVISRSRHCRPFSPWKISDPHSVTDEETTK